MSRKVSPGAWRWSRQSPTHAWKTFWRIATTPVSTRMTSFVCCSANFLFTHQHWNHFQSELSQDDVWLNPTDFVYSKNVFLFSADTLLKFIRKNHFELSKVLKEDSSLEKLRKVCDVITRNATLFLNVIQHFFNRSVTTRTTTISTFVTTSRKDSSTSSISSKYNVSSRSLPLWSFYENSWRHCLYRFSSALPHMFVTLEANNRLTAEGTRSELGLDLHLVSLFCRQTLLVQYFVFLQISPTFHFVIGRRVCCRSWTRNCVSSFKTTRISMTSSVRWTLSSCRHLPCCRVRRSSRMTTIVWKTFATSGAPFSASTRQVTLRPLQCFQNITAIY